MDGSRIGRNIAYWRERRGLTQDEFGRLMGQSRRWVQSLEGGQRQTDPRLSVLVRAAEVLRIPLETLLSSDHDPVLDGPVAPPPEASAVVDALYAPAPDQLLPTARLRARLDFCCEAFQACHYQTLGQQLPALMIQARVAAAVRSAGPEAHSLHSRTLQLATSFLHKYGSATATDAAIVADRALAAAERSGEPVAIGASARRVAKSLVAQGRPRAAVAFAVDSAERLRDGLIQEGALGLSTLGMLYLNAAVAASSGEATRESVRAAETPLAQAGETAQQQGGDLNQDWTAFGPTNVQLHRIDVLVRCEDGWSAMEAAEGLGEGDVEGLARERQARHLMTMARAQIQTRKREDAAASIVAAAKMAPEEVKGRPASVALISDLLVLLPRPSWELRQLALACGLRA